MMSANTRDQTPHSALLTIDLGALASNYRLLARKAGKAECGAAIKGDAYGIGVTQASKTLWAAGCRTFFVARPAEGEELRAILPRAVIYVLDGLHAGAAKYYLKHDLRPALASLAEVREWAKEGRSRPCALHVDTGINRLGLPVDDLVQLSQESAVNYKLNMALLMSHLACSDKANHPMNRQQLARFQKLRTHYPQLTTSLANSSGIFLGKDYAFDLVRPGIALYGGNPLPGKPNPIKPVAQLDLRVLQVRDVKKGDTVGYSATWKAQRDSRIAILGAGYRDGIPRKLSSTKPTGPAQVWLAGGRCPIVGRVSMDMTCIDVTDRPRVRPGMYAEVFGKHIPVDEAAATASTISYELLTHLGSRYARQYKGSHT